MRRPSSPSSFDFSLDRIQRWFEKLISRTLQLDQTTSTLRGLFVAAVFFATIFLYTAVRHPIGQLGTALLGLLVPAVVPDEMSPIGFLWNALGKTFLSPDVVLTTIAIGLPFLLALEFAALYQSDIYEIANTSVSRRFILQAAFAIPKYQTLEIKEEKLSAEQRKSPFIQIGGPGIVKPNPEFAVVFERLDGNPHFIRAGMSKKDRTLQGFERLRRIIDVRDHTFHYEKIIGRTKDGIKIEIQDVNLLFSIWRPSGNTPLNNPYPAHLRDLYWLTYQQVGEHWTHAMIELVEDHLLRFIQNHTISEILSAVGEPEIRRQVALESTIHRLAYGQPLRRPLRFIYSSQIPQPLPPPSFVPRPQLSNFFKSFTQEFPLAARQRGLRLEWINVGTWNTTHPILLDQHIEAWRLTSENRTRSSPRVLEEIRNQARLQTYQRIIQQDILLAIAQLSRQGYQPDQIYYEMVRYFEIQVSKIIAELTAEGKAIPSRLDTARQCLHTALKNFLSNSGATFL
ncbi:MAG: hypothetical protein AB1457_05375 [Chloroflexota bacterium]